LEHREQTGYSALKAAFDRVEAESAALAARLTE
jgi:hypothetical protein